MRFLAAAILAVSAVAFISYFVSPAEARGIRKESVSRCVVTDNHPCSGGGMWYAPTPFERASPTAPRHKKRAGGLVTIPTAAGIARRGMRLGFVDARL